jgi:hypothetical protein
MTLHVRSFIARYCLALQTAAAIVFVCSSDAAGVPVQNPLNGHYYERVDEVRTWPSARLAAEARSHLGVSGHLVTITSLAEQNFVYATFSEFSFIGGYQLPGAIEPDQGWQWVTGEPFVYTNWGQGSPNNIFGNNPNENAISFETGGFWNDAPDIYEGRFVVEYPVPEPGAFALAAIAGVFLCARWR